jgi:hypothetical protein
MSKRTMMKITIPLIILLFMSQGFSFAEPGVKITHPDDGTIVNPNQDIAVTIEAVDGFQILQGHLISAYGVEWFDLLPVTMPVHIVRDAVIETPVVVIAQGVDGNLVGDNLLLKVQQIAALTSLEIKPDKLVIFTDWNGNIEEDYYPYIQVSGIYSDGITRSLSKDAQTIYMSSNPSVASVDVSGKVGVYKTGQAVITVSNSGISAKIAVIFEGPTGTRPADTISPSIAIDVQPPANIYGWHNGDIAVTLTATDNDGGSGVQEIVYEFPYLAAEPTHVISNQVVIPFSIEGVNIFQCIAYDNDRNDSGQKSIELKLDKTPPVTTAVISPPPDDQGYIKFLPVKVSFTATDNLSDVAFTTPEKIFTASGIYQVEYYSRDVAGNVENTKTVTLNIMPQDTTAPKILLQLKPVTIKIGRITLTVPHLYTLVYSATDNESGIKELKAGLIVSDVSKFKANLIKSGRLHITINEKKKSITIRAPNPNDVLSSLNKEGLLLIRNNQPLFLQELPRSDEWTITELGGSMIILAPEIIFEAKAVDNANNAAVEKLEYKEHR